MFIFPVKYYGYSSNNSKELRSVIVDLLRIIAAPLIGGIVGYVTNYIAIKMLFRPANPVMIGRFRVPFTPGIVPKRKDKLAEILGTSIVDKFFNADDLEIVFLSDDFKKAVAGNIFDLMNNPETTLHFLSNESGKQNPSLENVKDELCIRIQAAILKSNLSDRIAQEGGRIFQKSTGNSTIKRLLIDETVSAVSGPLSKQIENYVIQNGRSVIRPVLDAEFEELSQEPVSSVVSNIINDKDEQLRLITDIYESFMRTHVRPIVESIDVGGMITEKVKQMKPSEIETLVVSVVSRELKYVVLLGALIGMLIGTTNIFI